MKVGAQDYDSMRYELGVDAGYTFNYGDVDQVWAANTGVKYTW